MGYFLGALATEALVVVCCEAEGVMKDYISTANRYNREQSDVRIFGDCYIASMIVPGVCRVRAYPNV